ncbi:hypothetical protein SynA1544_02534 [Synechococcus sp. A15-44]|nr:hypothetical protein SynA1544_02534 [Synechococcus sp. A15-44]
MERKRLVLDANILIRQPTTSPISPGTRTSMKLFAPRHCSA